MKVTNLDIWQAREPLQTLLEERWPVKTAYWLAKLARKLNEQRATIEAVRVKLVKQYGEQDERGQMQVKPDSPLWAAFACEFNDLLALEVEIDGEAVALPEVEGLTLKPETLLVLEPFVVLA
jgi:hypothetical protein